MEVQLWQDVQVGVQTALGAAKNLTAITATNPPVVSCAAHGFVAGDVILLHVRGMPDLDFAALRVANADTDDFGLEGIEGLDMGVFASGTAQKITFGAHAETFTEVTSSGGEAADVLVQTIHNRRGYNLPGAESPLTISFGSLWVPTDPALIELRRASNTRRMRAMQFEFPDGSSALFAGYPSASLVPGGSAGGTITTPVKINVRGLFQPYEATP